MARIRILPEVVSNKIAAGEVVERPASVVKELVENALDADGTRIEVALEKGGRRLIRVSDNGTGMTRDDALLSIERYATSKLYSDEDLFAIHTLGFRGEALPSIAAVSKFNLVTRTADADVGVDIRIQGGRLQNVVETGAPVGTQISVRQLFFNVPARRKFLKTINTEMGHVVETVAGIALGWHKVHFKLLHNGREIKRFSAVKKPAERAVDVLGQDLENDLCPLSAADGPVAVAGWVSSPAVTRATARGIYIYVNGRIVKDRVVQHALFEGYAERLVKSRYPHAVIFIRVPFDQVDVNVHPAKNEVRFAQSGRIHALIRDAVQDALRRHEQTVWSRPYPAGSAADRDRVHEPLRPSPFTRSFPPHADSGTHDAGAGSRPLPAVPVSPAQSPPADPPPKTEATASHQAPLWRGNLRIDTRFVGCLRETYLLFESRDGLLLVDQHAAHERIVYEKLKKHAAEAVAAQRLLIPETLELGFCEKEVLTAVLPELAALGFTIEPFGGHTWAIQSAPVLLAGREAAPLIRDMLETVIENQSLSALDQAVEDCLKTMACHKAVRAHQALTQTEALALLAELDTCENPDHCPHGRPTRVRWAFAFIEKAFQRRV